MTDPLHPLVLDLVEWIAREPRPYADVLEAWRTSCPRLAVWEEATEQGYVVRDAAGGRTMVQVTEQGRSFLRRNHRPDGSAPTAGLRS